MATSEAGMSTNNTFGGEYQALREVDGTKGWELEKYPGYGDLVKLVVNEVVDRLMTRQRKFKDLGRAIANQERTRLWATNDIICELRSTEIKESIRALHLSSMGIKHPITVTAEQIKRFPHLRYFWLCDVACQGDFTGCLSELKCICLHYPNQIPSLDRHPQFMATNLHLENVVVMSLLGHEFTEDAVRSLIKGARKLKTVPNLANLTNLVELLLSDASDSRKRSNIIQTCDLPWIGRLSNLSKQHLCLSNVHAISTEWGSLSLLKELTLYGLDLQTLEQLPSNLTVLELHRTRVKQVHLDGLPQLEELTVRSCVLLKRLSIPSSLRKLRGAEVYRCKELVEVQFLGVLNSLEILLIEQCKYLERLVCLSEEPGCGELETPELTVGGRRVSLVSSSLKMLQQFHLRREKILHAPIQGSGSEIEATNYGCEAETGDPQLGKGQENKEERERKLESAKAGGKNPKAEHYDQVIATDASMAQLKCAVQHFRVRYVHTQIPISNDKIVTLIGGKNPVDLIMVAQAVHWFNFPSFYFLMTRLLWKLGGVIAMWCYNDLEASLIFDPIMKRFHDATLRFWDPSHKVLN
ncbi:hypothetical protein NL676_019592 [Syzygium grande]|nr:hypothetical protein NL676_019592 [Syzygium grande]